jgi:uncharacterized OB-fold protein
MDKPVPQPDGLTRFYWEGARESSLLILRCSDCGYFLHPPDVACPRCLSADLVPTAVSGRGVIYAFTTARQPFDAAFAPDIPYVVALVELNEQPGLRLLTNIVDAPAEHVTGGAEVEVTFEPRGEWKLPQFRLAGVPAR